MVIIDAESVRGIRTSELLTMLDHALLVRAVLSFAPDASTADIVRARDVVMAEIDRRFPIPKEEG